MEQKLSVGALATQNGKNSISLWHAFLSDYLWHPSNLFYIVLLLIISPWIVWQNPNPIHVLWFGSGWLAFIPQEYWTHVHVLHARAPADARLYRYMYRLHYGHHDLPQRSDLMYIPLWLTLPILALNALVFWLVTNDLYQTASAICGVLAGYLVFEWTHLFCHLPYRPKTAPGRIIRQRHLWHHSHNETYWFSVSLPVLLMDWLCGTDGAFADVRRTGTGRYLGLTGDDCRLLDAREYFAARSSGNLNCSQVWLEYLKGLKPNV